MSARIRLRSLDSESDNRKSKICPEPCRRIPNRKWLGPIAFAVAFTLFGVVAQAQQVAKISRIGFLTSSPSANPARREAFRQGLRDLGYGEGKNMVVGWRYDEGNRDRQRAIAAEFVRLKVDVIVAGSSGQTRSAKEATTKIPIVMIHPGDPVQSGFVASLAQPGGNITGFATLRPELSGKRLELLKEVVPGLLRVAVFGTSIGTEYPQVSKEIQLAAEAFGVELQFLDILSPRDFASAFPAAINGRAEAALVGGVRTFILNPHRAEIAALAVKSRLPVMYEAEEEVDAGGLMSYGLSFTDLYRRAAT